MSTSDSESSTSASLLLRLRCEDRNEQAWREFVDVYGYRIYQWCFRRGLQTSDAEDVTQEVLLKLADVLKRFDYDSRQTFRGWLRRVTENAITDFLRRPKVAQDGSAIMNLLQSAEARTELASELEAAFDMELLQTAIDRVQRRVSPERFAVWKSLTESGKSAAEVARQMKMKLATVYTTRSQIQAMIREEVDLLEQSELKFAQG